MTNTKRWLDELPSQSYERELLLVGKSAQPAPGALEANWRALSVALGTSAISGVVASSAAASSASAKLGTSLAASKVASTGLAVTAAKSLAIGAALGLAVFGTGAIVEHSSQNREQRASASQPSALPTARRSSATPAAAAPAREIAAAPEPSAPDPTSSVATPPERLAASSAPPLQPSSAASASPTTPADKAASLSQQARELAELKRLIDSGAPSEALRRLPNFGGDTVSVLAEERDALYVQALARAQRRVEARIFAQRFIARYPHSPYFESMRQLLSEQ